MNPRATLWRAIETQLPRDLPGFLPKQRWFGAKARTLAGVEIEDGVALGDPESPSQDALLRTRLVYSDGGTDRYAVMAGVRGSPGELPVIAPIDGGGGWLVESATDPGAAWALLAVLEAQAPWPSRRGGRLRGGDTWPGETGAFRPSALPPQSLKALRAEQSNTSIRCGEAHVFKLFRRLESGENPELEIGRFLTGRTSFRSMPALRGSITYDGPEGAQAGIGIVQDWIPNEGDGWHHVVRLLSEGLAAGRSAELEALAEEMRGLGRTTAEFHVAIASSRDDPAFAPEPVRASDLEAWSAERHGRARRSARQLEEAAPSLAPAARELARAFVAGWEALPPAPGAAFARIRVHGDYHLGQTLRTATGFVLVDFEGEPVRSLEERRAKHCALKDVAGMLRSFDYAAETAGPGAEPAAREEAARVLRDAFLRGYRERAREGEAAFLPPDRAGFDAWVAFFELDKAIYEVEYEINHRPDWVGIPLRGIRRIVDSAG